MPVSYPIDDYQNRFDPSKHYEKALFRSRRGIQAADHNDVQEAIYDRIKRVGDMIAKDGSLVDRGACVVDDTGLVQMEAGEIYLRGTTRDLDAATFTIPMTGLVNIGVRWVESIITELEDPELVGQAPGTRNKGEPGGARLKVETSWSWDGDGKPGAFFPVYQVIDGFLLSKEPPPALDGVNNAIAGYDVDSTGGNYIIKGLPVRASYDRVSGKVTVLVGEGRARVNGFGVNVGAGLRLNWDAEVDTRKILAEPKVYSPVSGKMWVAVDNAPLLNIDQVRYTRQVEESKTRGAVSGGRDPLNNNSVLALVAVNQGGTWNGTTYVGGTNYAIGTEVKLTSGELDWSGAGGEPAPGSAYKCVYQYQTTTGAVITDKTDAGFNISGPVTGSTFSVDYTFALPRIDAIVLDQQGRVARIKGVATQYNPAEPSVPDTLLRIAGLKNTWGTDPTVDSDVWTLVPMRQINGMNAMIFDLFDLVAQERLKNDISLRDPSAKRGVFVDPFNNDNLRDAGITQSLAIVGGELQMGIVPTVTQVAASITTPQLLPYTVDTIIDQPFRTGTMLVNPYQAFDPIPPSLTIDPAVDFWTEVVSSWGSDITKRFLLGVGSRVFVTTTTGVQVESTTSDLQYLRQRVVNYTLSGMGAGETLTLLTFDGIQVVPSATVANPAGVLTGSFTIPANIPAGTKAVRATTGSGLTAASTFTGKGQITTEERRNVITQTFSSYDPLAQTLALDESRHVPGVDLWFANAGDRDIIVQIRLTEVGMPGQTIIAEKRIKPSDVQPSGTPTRVLFPSPVWLSAGTEYAVVILTDSATAAMHICQVGQFDSNAQRHISSQPYQTGVLLSSSNARSWTVHQDKDLTFRLLGCLFSATSRTIALGAVNVVDASDFIAELSVDIPATGAGAEVVATIPDGTAYRMTPDTPIALPNRVTGSVSLQLVMTGTAKVSPVLFPGVQFVAGNMEQSGTYVCRAFPAGNNSRISVTFEGLTPGTAAMKCEIQTASGTWQELTLTNGVNVGDGWIERNYTIAGFSATETRVRLTMSGLTSARPKARKLRAIATD